MSINGKILKALPYILGLFLGLVGLDFIWKVINEGLKLHVSENSYELVIFSICNIIMAVYLFKSIKSMKVVTFKVIFNKRDMIFVSPLISLLFIIVSGLLFVDGFNVIHLLYMTLFIMLFIKALMFLKCSEGITNNYIYYKESKIPLDTLTSYEIKNEQVLFSYEKIGKKLKTITNEKVTLRDDNYDELIEIMKAYNVQAL